jgi:hypothetical protein
MLCALACLAQTKVQLDFDQEAPRLIFPSSEIPLVPPGNVSVKHDKHVAFPGENFPVWTVILVWDRDSNNVALRKASNFTGPWKVQPSDYSLVGTVRIRVEHEGKPVSAAQVIVKDNHRTVSQLLDPTSKGEVKFFGLEPGTLHLAVKYRTEGKETTQNQAFDIALKRDKLEPTLIVSIPDTVDTTSSAAATTPAATPGDTSVKSGDQAAPPPTGNKLGSFFAFLFALAVAGLVVFGLLKYVKANQAQVAAQLKQMVAALPDPTPAGAQPPSAPAAPEPIKPIILDNAQPTVIGSATPITLSAEPRLVGSSGESLPLGEGENLVGRDPGLPISLETETSVSRRHAALIRTGTTVVVRDLGSTNGTYVNGQKVDGEKPLSTGDSVQFGQVRFRFVA